MAYWLMKSEPFKYSWDDLNRDGTTKWDGVRNYAPVTTCRRCRWVMRRCCTIPMRVKRVWGL